MRWREEIDELHQFFEAYFRGIESSLERVAAALAPGFKIVGPEGRTSDRTATLRMIEAGHSHNDSLVITTSDHRLVHQAPQFVVATYVEHHRFADGENRRLSTVVFGADPTGPNGVRWLHVHETWCPQLPASSSP